MAKLSPANVAAAFTRLRDIFGTGMTFRLLDPGDTFIFATGKDVRLKVKTGRAGWYAYADAPKGPKFRTGLGTAVTFVPKS